MRTPISICCRTRPAATAAHEARAQAAGLYEQASPLYARCAHDRGLWSGAGAAGTGCRTDEPLPHSDRCGTGDGFAVGIDGTDYRAAPAAAWARWPPLCLAICRPPISGRARRVFLLFASGPNLRPDTGQYRHRRQAAQGAGLRRRCADRTAGRNPATAHRQRERLSPVPWYSAPGYDPYRDYAATQVYYGAAVRRILRFWIRSFCSSRNSAMTSPPGSVARSSRRRASSAMRSPVGR